MQELFMTPLTIRRIDPPEIRQKKRQINHAFRAETENNLFVFALDQFPHWDILSSGKALSIEQMDDRKQAIEYAVHTATKNEKLRCDYNQTTKTTPFITWGEYKFYKLEAKAMAPFPTIVLSDTGDNSFVFPYPPSYPIQEIDVYQKNMCCLFLPSAKEKPVKLWSRIMGIPEATFSYTPSAEDTLSFFSNHERAHAIHICKTHRSNENRYYEELHADRTAIKGNPTLRRDVIHMRYANVLKSIPYYWNAPALENNNKKNPYTYQCDVPRTLKVYKELTSELKRSWGYTNMALCPAHFRFSVLRQLSAHGSFKRNTNTEQLAEKILQGAEHFCSGITYEKANGTRQIFDMGRGRLNVITRHAL
ncbi:MAG: hypothetical protein EOM37_02680 [Proteobacteria bacterium]|jgi:hypothetical protein|nr:hypothetical protein [Pseudomonadota bacterium]